MMRSLYGKLKAVFGLSKTVGSGDSTTSVFDMQGFTSVMIAITAGVFNLTSTNKVTLLVLDSSDNTTYGTVADADMEGMEAAGVFRAWDSSASDASTITELHYRGTKRYVKCTLVEAGTVSIPMAVAFIGGDTHNKPTVDA
jgi:hypothetical protein